MDSAAEPEASEPADIAIVIQRLRAGDHEALGALLEAKRFQLLAFLRKITGDHLLQVVSLEDLYQDVATSAWSAIPKIAGPDLEPMAWLFQLARRKVADAHRFHFGAQRRSRERMISIDRKASDDEMSLRELLVSSITSPSGVVSRNMKMSRVQAALTELGPEATEIIRLRYAEGLSTAEIAQRLNKTDVSIRVTLSRSMKKLADLLDHE